MSGTTLTATIAAEGEYEAYVSVSGVDAGALFLDSNQTTSGPGVGTFELAEGVLQYLHIKVKAGSDNPSGLIGTFTLSDFGFVFPNLFNSQSTDLTYWIVSPSGFGTELEYLTDLGPNGTAPWGNQEGIDPEARYIWSETDEGDHYFTLALHPTNSTPRRFAVGVQPEFNSIEGILTETEGVPFQLSYQDGPSRALAAAYPGRAGARSEETIMQGPGDLYTASWASYDSPDFVLTTNSDESFADISLNFTVKGTIVGGAGKGGLAVEKSISTSEMSAYARVNNGSLFSIGGKITARHEVGTDTPGTEVNVLNYYGRDLLPPDVSGDAVDFLAEYNVSIDRRFTTDTYTVEVGVPFSVVLNNQVISTATTDTGSAVSNIDFTGGVSFPTSGDVFNLPPGFTINSISGRVVNNRFEVPEDPPPIFVEGMFLNISDVDGESKAEGHEGWIDILDLSSGVFRLTERFNRSPAGHLDIGIVKEVDKSSPKLAEAITTGKVFPEVVIEQTRAVPGDQWTQFELRLENAQVTDYSVGGAVESVALDSFSLNYEKIDWIYRIIDSDGNSEGRVEAFWDLETDSGGSSSTSGDNEPPAVGPVANQAVDPATLNIVDATLEDMETNPDDLTVTVSTNRPDLIGDLSITGSGANRVISYTTSALWSGLASISVEVSDGTDTRSTAIPVLVDVEMTPFEGFLAAYFTEEEMFNPQIASPILDPDKDGIATVIEFLLGTNPNEFNLASEAIKVAHVTDEVGCKLTLDFQKRLDDPNIQGYIWTSQNLKDWERMDSSNPLYEESGQSGQNPLFEDTRATITFPDVCKEPHFIRYQVQDVF